MRSLLLVVCVCCFDEDSMRIIGVSLKNDWGNCRVHEQNNWDDKEIL